MSIWMSLALTLAQQGKYSTHPNPQVGCVIVKDGHVIATACHWAAGKSHAEVLALSQAGNSANGADMYVTLEPCSHHGYTPPCVDTIINSGISRIFVALPDPNPKVNGQGIKRLQAAGIEVHVGMLADKAYQINKAFFHYMRHHRPFVIAKWAMSLDGKIATLSGESKWITGEAARRSAHSLRAEVGAVLIGKCTAVLDNPELNVRILPEGSSYKSLADVRQPRPIIVTRTGAIPLSHHLLQPGAKTLIVTCDTADPHWLKALECRGIELQFLPTEQGRFNFVSVLDCLGDHQIISLLVEGGAQVLGQFLEQNLINRVQAYIAPKLIGTPGLSPMNSVSRSPLSAASSLHHCTSSRVGDDILIMGETAITPHTYKEFLNV
ncbi:bifunctional diaminohydroxyphosphoribosylaminopyrimidine deaminase/5-amino-6-(5-phosphoribosylamino)uracil reductase RibD [Candidatus Paracaedibacter symbiosus]|uniref:bifunctional diaminohydroxyphosphoribosylaminopyrimidine deaminase/5-amino-6-(5-phosphoribosylamino)uracil reductase RibD n=1 Tax=Candidatus Paracaedibacter symbiosus TaxID=244582 RepID=UPI0006903656|nr:bifunctional diaminohydroxyphosphoribosylaminopyrimidine deaminase/5-amino-6-(5-phosphoribosylamino)uracil reductase RibD [Candidatus Paracaedibacter symbiosus]